MHDRILARHSIGTASLLLALAAAAPGALADVAGQVLFAHGDVRIAGDDGATRPARRGDLIQEGERLITGNGAIGQVKTPDGARIGVRPDSNLQFPSRTAADGVPTMALSGGAVRLVNTDGSGPLRLRTPQGEVSVRDADALAGVLGGGAQGTPRTVVKLNRGRGQTRTGAGAGENIAAGEAVALSPTRPVPQRLASSSVPELSTRPFAAGGTPDSAPPASAFKASPVKSPRPLSAALPVKSPRPLSTALPVNIRPLDPTTGAPVTTVRVPPVLRTLNDTGRAPSLEIPAASTPSSRFVFDKATTATLGRKPPTTTTTRSLTLPTTKGGTVIFDPRGNLGTKAGRGGTVTIKRGG